MSTISIYRLETTPESSVKAKTPHLIVGESAVFVDGIHLGDFGSDGLTLEYGLLLSLGEQGDFVVHVLQHDVNRRFRGQLLGTIVLKNTTQLAENWAGRNWKRFLFKGKYIF